MIGEKITRSGGVPGIDSGVITAAMKFYTDFELSFTTTTSVPLRDRNGE